MVSYQMKKKNTKTFIHYSSNLNKLFFKNSNKQLIDRARQGMIKSHRFVT